MGMRFLRDLAALIFVVSVPLALITSNVRFAANEGRLYEYGFDKYDAEVRTGIDRDEVSRAGRELRAYFNNDAETVSIRNMEGGREVALFNERETGHLRDVKDLFGLTFRVQEATLVFVLAYVAAVFLWARERSLRSLAAQTLGASLLAAAVIVGLGVVALTGFDRAFEQFHLISFDNDLWKLNPRTDHLIQMFPEEFWFDASMFVGILTLVEAGLLALASGAYLILSRGRAVPALEPSGQRA
jgi:integral membrane protein (TIGR01906 family)